VLYTSIGTDTGIGIARGQYYWVLDIGCLSWYRSNPNFIVKCNVVNTEKAAELEFAGLVHL